MPAQHHLGGRLPVPGGDRGDRLVLEQRALGQRAPYLGRDAVPGVEVARFALLEGGTQLDLVEDRDHPGLVQRAPEVGGPEVGHADGAGPAVCQQLLPRTPGVEVAVAGGGGPVDEVQVHVVEAELRQSGVERGEGRVVSLVVVPQLGGDEQLVPGNSRGGDGAADPGLVAVGGGCVDAAVARLQGGQDRVGGLPVVDLEDGQPSCGMVTPLFSVTRGTVIMVLLLLVTSWGIQGSGIHPRPS